MSKVYNFSAGPSTLPEAVMKKVQQDFLDFNGLGMGLIEISHRSKDFMEVAAEATQDLKDLMNIPDNYKILFLHGGGRGMFANIPMNIGTASGSADYIVTGAWSGYAADEAKKYTNVNVLKADYKDDKGIVHINTKDLNFNKDADYVYACYNETIHGIEIFDDIDTGDKPLVADISSCILSREMDVSKFGILYAGAQKNIGPSGITIAIVRDDLLGRAQPITPSIWNFKTAFEKESMLNTPNTFAWYFSGLVFKWIKETGGVKAMAERNKAKAAYLYDFIDSTDFYSNNIAAECRSEMNVPFILKNEDLNAEFLAKAKENNLASLKGHKVVGGMRARDRKSVV